MLVRSSLVSPSPMLLRRRRSLIPGTLYNLAVASASSLPALFGALRASGSATEVGSDGLIRWRAQNLLLDSATLSAQSVTVVAQAYTLSIYGTGSVTLSGAHSAVLSGTGSGNRVTLTFTPTAGTLTLTVAGSVTTARLQPGAVSSAADDVATITTSAPVYLPRIEFLNGQSLGLLIEAAATNLARVTDNLQSASWSTLNSSVSPAETVASNDLFPIVESGSGDLIHGIYQGVTAVSGTRYCTSWIVYPGTRTFAYATEGNNVTAQAYFNLATGVVTSVLGNGSPTAGMLALGDGSWLVWLSFVPIANALNIQIRSATGDGGVVYAATPGDTAIYVGHPQVEVGSFPTSRIPNPTTGSAVRPAEDYTISGSDFTTLLGSGSDKALATSCRIDALGRTSGTAPGPWRMTDGTSNNCVGVYIDDAGSDAIVGTVTRAGVTTTVSLGTATAGAAFNVGVRCTSSGVHFSLNGGAPAACGSGAAPTVDRIEWGRHGSGGHLGGTIASVRAASTVVTDAQLQAMTA